METENVSLEQTLKELREIRCAIDRVQSSKRGLGTSGSNYVQLIVHGIAAAAAGALLVEEILVESHTATLLASVSNKTIQITGLSAMGVILIALLIVAYFFIGGAAHKAGESAASYISRNITYVSNVSFLSDLFLKFIILCALVLAQKPEWFGPALIFFTGDYIFQGRFFNLPLVTGTVLASGCFVLGLLQVLMNVPSVAPALGIFLILTCYSMWITYIRAAVEAA